jgi:prepilin-type N-terminal cleavage/methylation domain-containing protein
MEHVNALRRSARNQQGFSLPESLVAMAILSVGLVGVLAAIGHGTTSVDSARRGTTALFLAEQRIEQVKDFALSTSAGQGWAVLATGSFAAEGYNAIAGSSDYRRTVTVTPVGTLKLVDVQVFYRPVAGSGEETSVTVSTQLATR